MANKIEFAAFVRRSWSDCAFFFFLLVAGVIAISSSSNSGDKKSVFIYIELFVFIAARAYRDI